MRRKIVFVPVFLVAFVVVTGFAIWHWTMLGKEYIGREIF